MAESSIVDQMRVKYLGNKTNLNTKQQALLDTAKQNVGMSTPKATSATPTAVTSDVVTQTVQAPINNAKTTMPQGTPQVFLNAMNNTNTSTPVNKVPYAQTQVHKTTKATTQVPTQATSTQPIIPQVANIPLRQTLESQGIKVGWDATTGTVTANGMPIDTSRMSLQNGSYQATQEDINNVLAQIKQPIATEQQGTVTDVSTTPSVPLRQTLEAQGIDVQWDHTNGQVTANGIPVDVSNMKLVNGSYQASQEDINKIVEASKPMEAKYMEQTQAVADNLIDQLGMFQNELKEYKPLYAEDITNALRQAFGDPFKYDPNMDAGLKDAMKYAEREIINSMNTRGILNSTITRDAMGEMISSMIPKYEQIAFERYQTNINNQLKRIDVLNNLSQQDYQRYTDYIDMAMANAKTVTATALDTMKENYNIMYDMAYTRPMLERKQKLDETQYLIDQAYTKMKNQGYVDNEIAQITGLTPGMLTPDMQKELNGYRLSLEEQQQLIDKEISINDIQHRAKLQELEAQRSEAETMQYAQQAVTELENYLSTLPADEALRQWNAGYGNLINQLGDSYSYVSEEIGKINDNLLKRSQDEAKFGLDKSKFGLEQSKYNLNVQKESRMARQANAKTSGSSNKSGITFTQAKEQLNSYIKSNYLTDDSVNTVTAIANKIDTLPLSETDKNDLKMTYLGLSNSGKERTIESIMDTQNYSYYVDTFDKTLRDAKAEQSTGNRPGRLGIENADKKIVSELKNNKDYYIDLMGQYYYNALLKRYS